MIFDEWLKAEMGKLEKIQDELKMKYGSVDNEILKILFEDAKEPWGFVSKQAIQQANTQNPSNGKNEASMKSGLAEIIAKYDLLEDNGLLKPRRFLDQGFKDLAKELEVHGYRYNKERKVFLPPWNGVKR